MSGSSSYSKQSREGQQRFGREVERGESTGRRQDGRRNKRDKSRTLGFSYVEPPIRPLFGLIT
jgi:hypothetical protein